MRLILILVLVLSLYAEDYHNNDRIEVDGNENTVNKTIHNHYVIEHQIDTIYIRMTDTVYVTVDGKIIKRPINGGRTARQMGYVTDW